MIKILRYISISLTGLFSILTLIKGGNIPIIGASILLLILWLFFGGNIKFFHDLTLPLYSAIVILGVHYGNSDVIQIFLFLMMLFSWELESLFIDSKGIIHKEDEWKLIKPLLLREILSVLVLLLCRGVSLMINYQPGFWFMLILLLILVFIMRNIFKRVKY